MSTYYLDCTDTEYYWPSDALWFVYDYWYMDEVDAEQEAWLEEIDTLVYDISIVIDETLGTDENGNIINPEDWSCSDI